MTTNRLLYPFYWFARQGAIELAFTFLSAAIAVFMVSDLLTGNGWRIVLGLLLLLFYGLIVRWRWNSEDEE